MKLLLKSRALKHLAFSLLSHKFDKFALLQNLIYHIPTISGRIIIKLFTKRPAELKKNAEGETEQCAGSQFQLISIDFTLCTPMLFSLQIWKQIKPRNCFCSVTNNIAMLGLSNLEIGFPFCLSVMNIIPFIAFYFNYLVLG